LPPLVISEQLVAEQRQRVGELPHQLRQRWIAEFGLSPDAAATLTQHPAIARFFTATLQTFPESVKVANWICTEVLRSVKLRGLDAEFSVRPAQVAELLALVDQGEISGKQAKEVHAVIEGSEQMPRQIVKQRGMRIVSDDSALLPLCQALLESHPAQVQTYRSGKHNVIGFFVGQVMRQTRGSADPRRVNALLRELLEQGKE
jgi:aspartyl-tRNA(Asn)/glutamyl-tRNA(Gln) amidotransferase subunit B